jgi:hypothetical protein
MKNNPDDLDLDTMDEYNDRDYRAEDDYGYDVEDY